MVPPSSPNKEQHDDELFRKDIGGDLNTPHIGPHGRKHRQKWLKIEKCSVPSGTDTLNSFDVLEADVLRFLPRLLLQENVDSIRSLEFAWMLKNPPMSFCAPKSSN